MGGCRGGLHSATMGCPHAQAQPVSAGATSKGCCVLLYCPRRVADRVFRLPRDELFSKAIRCAPEIVTWKGCLRAFLFLLHLRAPLLCAAFPRGLRRPGHRQTDVDSLSPGYNRLKQGQPQWPTTVGNKKSHRRRKRHGGGVAPMRAAVMTRQCGGTVRKA